MSEQTTDRLPKLGARELDALCEIARFQAGKTSWNSRAYFHRKASMRKLAAHGLVKRYGGTEASPAWQITEEGRKRVPHIGA